MQLLAVRGCHTWQLGSAPHHHWSQICSRYHFIAVCCVQFCLIPRFVLNDGWCVLHVCCVIHSTWPRLLPLHSRVSAQHSHSTKKDSCANMWVSIGQHISILQKTMKLFRAAVFRGRQRHNDSVHLHALGLVLKVTNAFKIVTQALPTSSYVAHTWKTVT